MQGAERSARRRPALREGGVIETLDIVKVYGPLALGWVAAIYLLKFILDRYNTDIESRVKLATALDGLTRVIADMEKKNV